MRLIAQPRSKLFECFAARRYTRRRPRGVLMSCPAHGGGPPASKTCVYASRLKVASAWRARKWNSSCGSARNVRGAAGAPRCPHRLNGGRSGGFCLWSTCARGPRPVRSAAACHGTRGRQKQRARACCTRETRRARLGFATEGPHRLSNRRAPARLDPRPAWPATRNKGCPWRGSPQSYR